MTNVTGSFQKRKRGRYIQHAFIHTHIFKSKISNEAGFGHRQPRLVTYPAQAKHNKAWRFLTGLNRYRQIVTVNIYTVINFLLMLHVLSDMIRRSLSCPYYTSHRWTDPPKERFGILIIAKFLNFAIIIFASIIFRPFSQIARIAKLSENNWGI